MYKKRKTVYWGLVNSNVNKRDVQTGCSGYVHRAAMMRMWEYLQLTMGLVSVYETEFEFRSLMAWGKKLFLSLSVFAIMLLKRLPDGSKQKKMVTGVSWIFEDFSSSAFTAFDVDGLQRGRADLEMRSAKRTTLCRALQSWFVALLYHTEIFRSAAARLQV